MKHAFAATAPGFESADTSFFQFAGNVYNESSSRRDPFHRFLSLMRILRAGFYVVEDLDRTHPELAYEAAAATLRLGRPIDVSAQRFSFFNGERPPGDAVEAVKALDASALLGYAVVVTLKGRGGIDPFLRVYLHESLVAWPMPKPSDEASRPMLACGLGSRENYYVHCTRQHQTTIGTVAAHRDFAISGSFFTQQSDLVSVCAHAAIRMALNSTNLIDGKLTNEAINKILGLTFDSPATYIGHSGEDDDQTGRKSGLTELEIRKVIRAQGLNIIRLDLREDTSVDYDRFVYPFMESGLPVILGIDGHDTVANKQIRHVVTIVGHSLNADRWAPEAQAAYAVLPRREHLSAEDWTDHFIINDDQHGMYATLQTELLRSIIVPSRNPSLHTILALAIVPDEVKLAGHWAEAVGSSHLHRVIKSVAGWDGLGRWVTELQNDRQDYNTRVVCRPILMRRDQYRRSLDGLVEESNARRAKQGKPPQALTGLQRQRLERLPAWVWVCELTIPQLYTCNVKKIGEAVVDATVDLEAFEDPSSELFATARLIWFDGLWTDDELTDKVEQDWPVSDLVSIYRIA